MRQLILAALLAASLAGIAPVALAETHDCSAEYDYDADTDFDGGDLVFERDEVEVARITAAPELLIDGDKLALDAPQQAALDAFRATHDALIDEAREIGAAGARLGGAAAFHVLAGLLTGTADEAGAKIEAEAAVIEARAEALCVVINQLRDDHRALAAAVPEFGRAVPLQ